MLIAYFVRSQERAKVFDFMMTTEFGEHWFTHTMQLYFAID